jgi:hypothetical protein
MAENRLHERRRPSETPVRPALRFFGSVAAFAQGGNGQGGTGGGNASRTAMATEGMTRWGDALLGSNALRPNNEENQMNPTDSNSTLMKRSNTRRMTTGEP